MKNRKIHLSCEIEISLKFTFACRAFRWGGGGRAGATRNGVEGGAYLVHARVGEEQRGVVDGDDGRGREGGVPPLRLEVLDERLPHLQDRSSRWL